MKSIKALLLLLAFYSNSTVFYGQQKMILKDAETLEVLETAEVIFSLAKDMKKSKGCVSNNLGEIAIPYAKACYYKAFFIGYETKKGKIRTAKNTFTIFLNPIGHELDQVVITGSRAPRSIKLSPVVTQVIPASRLTESGFKDIQGALMQEMPGLNFQKVGFGTDINISGLDARHILFLIDGERLTGEMAGNLDYQRFNLHAIDRIEIVKGASSTLYGSRAAGAVINMITKKTKKPFVAKIGARYGQMNEVNYKKPRKSNFLYMYQKNVDKPNLQAWASVGSNIGDFTSQTDVLYSSSDAFYLFQSGYDIKKFPADPKIGLKEEVTITSWLPRPPLGVEGSEHVNISQKLYYDPSTNLSAQLYGSLFFLNTYDLVQDLQFSQAKDITGGVNIAYNFNDFAKVTLSMHSDFYKRFKRQERIDTRDIVYDSQIYQPRIIISSEYFKNNSILFGIEYFKDDLTSDRFKNNKLVKRSKKDLDVFLQNEYNITDKIMIVGGFRSSYNENYGTNIAPKLAVKYSPSNPVSIRFNYAAGYRSPSIKELYFNWDHLGMFQIVGDENLQPEKNNYFSISSEYRTRKLFFSGNVYANYFRNKIEGVWRIYNFQYNFEYRNLSKNAILGTEIVGRVKLSDPLSISLSYSYVHVDKVEGIQINTSSPHTGNIRFEYQYKKEDYKLKANLSLAITGKKEFSVQDKIVLKGKTYDAFFEVETPTYVMCNLSINQKFKNRTELTTGIDNLFNYKPKTLGAGVTMFNVPATSGLRFFVQMNFTLDKFFNN